jgi:hypothetical protein
MKISGFTIIRNALINDYPIVEAICSILPVVDEMIVLIGNSEDRTEELIGGIPSEKIKIYHSIWDPGLTKGGEVLAVETDKARQFISPDADWSFYIQADEVVHEKYHDAIRKTAEKYKDDKRVEGLVFKYLHFYGNYEYVADSRKWYSKEVRIIRNDPGIQSYRDAQGFRRGSKKIKAKLVDAVVFHYGWVKSPKKMKEKITKVLEFWSDSTDAPVTEEVFDFSQFDSLRHFEDDHPLVMRKRIEERNWSVDLDISKKKLKLKNQLLYWYEKKTGKRLFEFRNFKII